MGTGTKVTLDPWNSAGNSPRRATAPHRRLPSRGNRVAVHVGYHKTASTCLQLDVFPRISGIRYGNPFLALLIDNLSRSRDETFAAPLLRVAIDQMEAAPGGPLLLSSEG